MKKYEYVTVGEIAGKLSKYLYSESLETFYLFNHPESLEKAASYKVRNQSNTERKEGEHFVLLDDVLNDHNVSLWSLSEILNIDYDCLTDLNDVFSEVEPELFNILNPANTEILLSIHNLDDVVAGCPHINLWYSFHTPDSIFSISRCVGSCSDPFDCGNYELSYSLMSEQEHYKIRTCSINEWPHNLEILQQKSGGGEFNTSDELLTRMKELKLIHDN